MLSAIIIFLSLPPKPWIKLNSWYETSYIFYGTGQEFYNILKDSDENQLMNAGQLNWSSWNTK